MCSATKAACLAWYSFVLNGEEFRTEAFHLLLCRGAHVGRGDDGAQAPRGGDRLQAGDAHAHDEDLRGGHGAGRGHHHRQRAAVLFRRVDHRAIAGEVRLAGQHVHGLRARDARHQLHGERDEPRIRHLLERGVVAVRIHDRDDERAALVIGEFVRQWPAHLEHHVGVTRDVVADLGAGGHIVIVEDTGRYAGAASDDDIGAESFVLLHRFRSRRDAALIDIGLTRYRNPHPRLLACRPNTFRTAR
jgi:hypothetical protein